MWEKIVDMLKSLLEKHFIPALCSVIPTTIIFCVIPDDNSVVLKLGKYYFLFVIFVVWFLIIEFIIFIFRRIPSFVEKHQNKKKKQSNKLAEYFDMLDSLEPWKYNLIEYLLENENEIIITSEEKIDNEYDLDFFINFKKVILKNTISSVELQNLENEIKFKKGDCVVQIKLKDNVYQYLKYIKKKYGKISRF